MVTTIMIPAKLFALVGLWTSLGLALHSQRLWLTASDERGTAGSDFCLPPLCRNAAASKRAEQANQSDASSGARQKILEESDGYLTQYESC